MYLKDYQNKYTTLLNNNVNFHQLFSIWLTLSVAEYMNN